MGNNQLLVRYIRLALSEDHSARVPNQLVSDTGESEDDQGKKDEGDVCRVDEFSGVGAIAGYTAPLGANPDQLGRKKNSKRK